MHPHDCTLDSHYFDPNTGRCHPCSDCGPGRSPIKFCEDECNRRNAEDNLIASTVNQHTSVVSVHQRKLAEGISTGVLVIFVIVIAIGVVVYRLLHRTHRNRRQPRNQGALNQNNSNEASYFSTHQHAIDTNTIDTSLPSANGRILANIDGLNSSDLNSAADVTASQNGRISTHAPLLVTRNGGGHNSLPTEMQRHQVQNVNGLTRPALPRHVNFSDTTEYFEFSSDDGLTEDECVRSYVTQPQQNDAKYLLIPSVHASLPTTLRTDSIHSNV